MPLVRVPNGRSSITGTPIQSNTFTLPTVAGDYYVIAFAMSGAVPDMQYITGFASGVQSIEMICWEYYGHAVGVRLCFGKASGSQIVFNTPPGQGSYMRMFGYHLS